MASCTTTSTQQFSSAYIDRVRLESVVRTLNPDPAKFKVSRKLDYWVVEAPSRLNDVTMFPNSSSAANS
jgi:hypothetical protein